MNNEIDINDLTPEQYKVRENRARRAASRQGLKIVKSRARDPRALDYCGYMIVSAADNLVVAGELGSSQALNLEQVEAALRGE